MLTAHARRLARRLASTVAGLALAGVISGCSRTVPASSDRTLRVALSEYRVNPQSARASAGTLIVLVHNYGRLIHNLTISLGGQSIESTKPISPGQSSALIVTLGPGTYLIYSSILSDQALGEFGTLTVTS